MKKALEKSGDNKTIVIRFEGTNKDIGVEIITSTKNAVSVDGIVEGVEAIAGRCSL